MRFNKKWETIVNNDENIITNEDYAIAGQARNDENNLTKKSYSPITLFPYYPKKKVAFTLAEVLITLGIIGVVAAITIPTLIEKHKERVTVTKVKKFYSVINQALLSAINKNGNVDEWDFPDNNSKSCSQEFVKNLLPELKITKDCKCGSGCIPTDYTFLNNNSFNHNYDNHQWYYKIILADGSHMWIRDNESSNCNLPDVYTQNVCGLIWYDINGKQAPNTLGKDLFVFYIMKDRVITHQNDDCNRNSKGWGCAKHILANDNMDYLH